MLPSRYIPISNRSTTPEWHILLAVFAGALLVTGSMDWVGIHSGIPLTHLTGDPAMINHTPIHMGILSNLGVMLWAAAAGCAFLGAALLHGDYRMYRFLLVSGFFSVLLAMDDSLTIHEHVLPHYLHIPEMIAYIGYLILTAIYLLFFRKDILAETEYPALAMALLFFGLSVMVTRIFPDNSPGAFLKDTFKFYGIVYWLVFFFWTVIRFAKRMMQEKPAGG